MGTTRRPPSHALAMPFSVTKTMRANLRSSSKIQPPKAKLPREPPRSWPSTATSLRETARCSPSIIKVSRNQNNRRHNLDLHKMSVWTINNMHNKGPILMAKHKVHRTRPHSHYLPIKVSEPLWPRNIRYNRSRHNSNNSNNNNSSNNNNNSNSNRCSLIRGGSKRRSKKLPKRKWAPRVELAWTATAFLTT